MNIESGKNYTLYSTAYYPQRLIIKILDIYYPGLYNIKYKILNGKYSGHTNITTESTLKRNCNKTTKMEEILYL